MRAWLREHHVAAGRFDDAAAVTVIAAALGRVQPPGAVTCAAVLLARYRDMPLTASNRVLETERDFLMKIDTADRFVALARFALIEHVGKQIAERGRGRSNDGCRKIKSLEPEGRSAIAPTAGGAAVVAAAALRVAEGLVCLRNFVEVCRGGAITRIDIRVISTREPLVGALDVARRRGMVETEDDVEVHDISDRRLQIEKRQSAINLQSAIINLQSPLSL